MAYVTIDEDNNVTGIFAVPQPDLEGYEKIEDDDARITAFQSAQLAASQQSQKP